MFTDENVSVDHVFPEVIKGWFTVDFVCRNCNSRFGSSFDSDLRRNAYVHAALKLLGTDSKYLKGQPISWSSPAGHAGKMGVPRGFDAPVIIPSKQKDGSIISDDRLFAKNMGKELRALGWTDVEIKEYFVDVISRAPLGILIPVCKPGGPIITWLIRHGDSVSIQYGDMTAPIRFCLVAKIAIELWCAFGFPSAGPFDPRPLIDSIMANQPNQLTILSPAVRAKNSVYELKYQPFHYCAFGVASGVAVGLIGFFGILSYAIAFGEVLSSEIGDWRSDFWAFPTNEIPIERQPFPVTLPKQLTELEFVRMEAVAAMHRGRSRLTTSDTKSAPR